MTDYTQCARCGKGIYIIQDLNDEIHGERHCNRCGHDEQKPPKAPKMNETYDSGYPTVPMGGGNPYYACQYCGLTDPQINGVLENHLSTCEYRQRRELEIQLGKRTTADAELYGDRLREILEDFGVMDDELYDALDELIQPGHY